MGDTIIAYLRHAAGVGRFVTPGWQHLRRYQPEANHNRASPRHRSLHSPYVADGHIALLAPLAIPLHGTSATMPPGSAWGDIATICHQGERSEQRAGGTRLWLAPHSQRRRCRLCGGAIIQEAAACRRYAIMVVHFLHPSNSLRKPNKSPHCNPHCGDLFDEILLSFGFIPQSAPSAYHR